MRPFPALVLASTLALPFAQSAHAEASLITVTGEAHVAAAPDMAALSLGVTTTAATASEAMAANSAAMAAVMARLRDAGVVEADLQTSNLALNPNWSNSASDVAPTINGYAASNQLSVQIRALDTLGKVVDAAISDGANTLNGVNFDITNPRPLQDQAREAAVVDAIAKATLLAKSAGVTLGKIVSISESGPASGPMPMFRVAASEVPVATGQIDISQSVTLVFEITN